MKLRNLLMVFVITFTGLGFSACSDESEEIVPGKTNSSQAAETTGTQGETTPDDRN